MQSGEGEKTSKRLPSLKHLNSRRAKGPSTEGTIDGASTLETAKSATTKKSFVPNLNVTRAVPVEIQAKESNAPKFAKKDRNRNWKDKNKREFIQTSGVFSEGVASQQMGSGTKGSVVSSSTSDGSSAANVMIAECLETESLDDIMTGNFIADLKNEKCPLSLVGSASNLAERSISASDNRSADEKLYLFQFPSFTPFALPQCQPGEKEEIEKNNGDHSNEAETQKALNIKDLNEGVIGSFEIMEDGSMRMVFGSEEEKIMMNCKEATEDNNLTFSLLCQDQVAQTMQFCGNIENQLICTPFFQDLLFEEESSSSDEQSLSSVKTENTE